MSKNMLDGGQVIVDYLIREKVPYAFGLCGHGNIQFIDARPRQPGEQRHRDDQPGDTRRDPDPPVPESRRGRGAPP